MDIIGILVGGGLLTLIQFLISRHDKKHDKFQAIEKAIDKLSDRIDELDGKGDMRNAVENRVRILRFEDELLEGRRHSKDSWDQCLSDVTDYEKYCAEHPDFKNNQTAATIQHIEKEYQERLEKHDFL